MARLQGESWYRYRKEHKLTLLCISISSNGNYRVDVYDELNHHNYHWLHPIEVKNLKSSGWLEKYKVLNSELLYDLDIQDKLKQGKQLYKEMLL